MTAVRLVGIRDEALSVDEVYAAVSDPAAGGICLFVGTIRAEDDGRGVEGLGYSAHPTAPGRAGRGVRRGGRPARRAGDRGGAPGR